MLTIFKPFATMPRFRQSFQEILAGSFASDADMPAAAAKSIECEPCAALTWAQTFPKRVA